VVEQVVQAVMAHFQAQLLVVLVVMGKVQTSLVHRLFTVAEEVEVHIQVQEEHVELPLMVEPVEVAEQGHVRVPETQLATLAKQELMVWVAAAEAGLCTPVEILHRRTVEMGEPG
jgi:hypothetical protein